MIRWQAFLLNWLTPDQHEIVHVVIAADVTILIAYREDRDRHAIINHRKVDDQMRALALWRSSSYTGRAGVEIHAQRGNRAVAGKDITAQAVIARRQREVLGARICQTTTIGLELERVLPIGDELRIRNYIRTPAFDVESEEPPASCIACLEARIDDHIEPRATIRRRCRRRCW